MKRFLTAAAVVAGAAALNGCALGALPANQGGGGGTATAPLTWTVWDDLAECESGGNWAINTGSRYSGGLQFLGSTWVAYGGQEFAAHARQATREQQIVVAERIREDVGFKAWPACSRELGLR